MVDANIEQRLTQVSASAESNPIGLAYGSTIDGTFELVDLPSKWRKNTFQGEKNGGMYVYWGMYAISNKSLYVESFFILPSYSSMQCLCMYVQNVQTLHKSNASVQKTLLSINFTQITLYTDCLYLSCINIVL